jgi:putative spermidine/putrescine transport system ATP-binding protein/putrescine transport system ATP-binding protein
MENSLEFQAVTKTFGSVAAIDGVSFDIAHGEIVALLGPSGCGKTTILRVIAGFETPDAGSVRIAGIDMARKRPYERNIGLLHRGFPKHDIPRRVAEMLDLVKLPSYGERFPNQLSGGQQQRVALARALATRPGVVLLDEPLSALDAKLRHELRTELREVLAVVGSSAIVVTHDHEEAMSLGERVFIMNRGRIVQQGTPDDIYARPQSRFVAEFMGRSNWFAGSLRDAATFQSTCGLTLQVAPRTTTGAHDLCVRPENVDLLPESADPGPNRIPGRVVDVALLGAVRQIVVALHGGRQILVAQPNRAHTGCVPGQNVVVGFAPDACMLVPAEPS